MASVKNILIVAIVLFVGLPLGTAPAYAGKDSEKVAPEKSSKDSAAGSSEKRDASKEKDAPNKSPGTGTGGGGTGTGSGS